MQWCGDVLEHRTDGTDAFETLYIGCEKFPQHDLYPIAIGGVRKLLIFAENKKKFCIFVAIKIKRSMKKIVFILLIFCSFLVVWGCNKNKTKCVPQKEATSDSSMRSNDDTLSLMIEHEVDDVDYGVIIKRGDKTIHRFGYKYPEDDDLVPNEERIDSCLLTDLNFDGIKEDVLFYLGSFGASGTKHFDAYVWNPNTEHYDDSAVSVPSVAV